MKNKTNSLKLLYNYLFALLLVLTCFTASLPAKPLRIYIVTDLEGASGVYKFAQTREPGNPLGEKAKEYLMGDIAAVVKGLRSANVFDIVVLDGHGSQAFVPHLMAPGAKYITGKPRPGPLTGLDGSFDGLIQLGAHAMMGTPDGVLCHTQSSRSENRYWYNGVTTASNPANWLNVRPSPATMIFRPSWSRAMWQLAGRQRNSSVPNALRWPSNGASLAKQQSFIRSTKPARPYTRAPAERSKPCRNASPTNSRSQSRPRRNICSLTVLPRKAAWLPKKAPSKTSLS